MKKRVKTLYEIDKTLDNFCRSCIKDADNSNRYCLDVCPVGQELQYWGNQLTIDRENSLEKLLSKGEKLTEEDIKCLVDHKIPRYRIVEALGMDKSAGSKYLISILGRAPKRTGNMLSKQEEMAMRSSNFKKAIKLLDKNKDAKKVSKELGLKESTIKLYDYINKRAIRGGYKVG